MKIRLPIDLKSLHFNIFNDNNSGHTATVSTPIKQGAVAREDLLGIFKIEQNGYCMNSALLINELTKTARQAVKITGVFVFDKIAVNGERIKTDKQYCIYTREEVDSSKVHCGRIKMHYPTRLKYSEGNVDIDNKAVIEVVSSAVHDYAFLVNAFEYDTETGILNFSLTIVGENKIPYSKVFINERGVGKKFAVMTDEYVDVYDSEIVSLRQRFGDSVGPENFNRYMAENKQSALVVAEEFVKNKGATCVNPLIHDYPYSLYDIEYRINGQNRYLIVCFTSTKINYFNLSAKKIKFLNDFDEHCSLLCVTDINGEPKIKEYFASTVNSMGKTINSVMFKEREYNE